MIELYCISKKTGAILSSNKYLKRDLDDIFGQINASKLRDGLRVENKKFFWQEATVVNEQARF